VPPSLAEGGTRSSGYYAEHAAPPARSLQEQVEALAAREGVSVGEFVVLALSEKVATADY
jgi:hypothetical protein